MGAGILPTTIYNNKIYFLFGKENSYDETPGWSDFAGGQEANETPLETAIREGAEELTGFLGSAKDVKELLHRHGNYVIEYDNYHTHLFPMEWDPHLPTYFNNNRRFLDSKLNLRKLNKGVNIFEKQEIRWVPIDQMNRMRSQYRPFYRHIVDEIWSHRENIDTFIRSCLDKKGTYKRKTRKRR